MDWEMLKWAMEWAERFCKDVLIFPGGIVIPSSHNVVVKENWEFDFAVDMVNQVLSTKEAIYKLH